VELVAVVLEEAAGDRRARADVGQLRPGDADAPSPRIVWQLDAGLRDEELAALGDQDGVLVLDSGSCCFRQASSGDPSNGRCSRLVALEGR
jgi:hypothetical protein